MTQRVTRKLPTDAPDSGKRSLRLRVVAPWLVLAFAAIGVVAILALSRTSRPDSEAFSPAVAGSTEPVSASDLDDEAPVGGRPVYRYSVIRGGVYSPEELIAATERDEVAFEEYGSIARTVRASTVTTPRRAYMSYRVGEKVYWTKQQLPLNPGETILTNGDVEIRARCGNQISDLPMTPVLAEEPEAAEFERLVDDQPGSVAELQPPGVLLQSPSLIGSAPLVDVEGQMPPLFGAPPNGDFPGAGLIGILGGTPGLTVGGGSTTLPPTDEGTRLPPLDIVPPGTSPIDPPGGGGPPDGGQGQTPGNNQTPGNTPVNTVPPLGPLDPPSGSPNPPSGPPDLFGGLPPGGPTPPGGGDPGGTTPPGTPPWEDPPFPGDEVPGVAVVPEPGTLFLLGTALAGIGAVALRKRQRARRDGSSSSLE